MESKNPPPERDLSGERDIRQVIARYLLNLVRRPDESQSLAEPDFLAHYLGCNEEDLRRELSQMERDKLISRAARDTGAKKDGAMVSVLDPVRLAEVGRIFQDNPFPEPWK